MCCGRWTPDGDFFPFLAGSWAEFPRNLAGVEQIWALDERRSWLHHPNQDPVELTIGPILWLNLNVSRDGKTVYSTGATLKGELVGYDPKLKELLPYLGGISAEYVAFSRDGKYLVYVTFPEGIMWRADRDGSGLQQLTNPPMNPVNPKWSPDGTQILFFDMAPSNRRVIYTVASQGGAPKRLLPGDDEPESDPVWSPDGKRVVFEQDSAGSDFNSLGAKLRILELDTGKVTDLPPCPKSCWSPRWSPDGRYILGLTFAHDDLALFDFKTNQWSLFNLKYSGIEYPTWSHDGHFIYFESTNLTTTISSEPGIYRIPAAGGRAEKVVDLKGFRDGGFLGVWSGLDPGDNPLLIRGVGTRDVYALALDRR